VTTRSHARALGALFLLLAAGFAGGAFTAARAHEWVITVAASAIAVWFFGLALRGLRP
jgi:hypothetical protein